MIIFVIIIFITIVFIVLAFIILKVREYELREIDSQSQIRELEQMLEINKDKIAALQRSENRLRYRVQELEGLGAPVSQYVS